MRWACLLLPHLAMDAVLRDSPDPAASLVLVSGPTQRRVLYAVNPAARRQGLRAGMLLSAAQALTADFGTVAYDPKRHARARNLLASWAYGFSSQVSQDFAHALVLEVGGSQALFGPWPQLQRRLRQELTQLGYRHRLVAAPNPYAARILANTQDGMGVDTDLLERALDQVPVERSGLEPAVVTALASSGLRRLQQVFALPRASLARRFPASTLLHLDALRGWHRPPLSWYAPPDRFKARIEFDSEVESSQALVFPLRRLTADLATFLSSRDGGVQRFVLAFAHEHHPDTLLEVGLLAPERDPAMLFELARGRLEHVRLPAAVRGLQLIAHELPPFVPAGRDLFDTRPQQAVPWTQLRERLRARLGDDAVQGLGLRADHRPERATRTDVGAPPPDTLPPRPSWLLVRPTPLRGKVDILAGPERIESGWWDNGDVRRDYYVLRTAQGQRAWGYCAPGEAGPYMLHGWFA